MGNPYPGLRPFTSEESPLFMGREIITESITTRVRLSPLTVMFARSGVGKSSFLNCRLVPDLKQESAVMYKNEWGGQEPADEIDQLLSELGNSSRHAESPVLVLDQFEDVFKVSSHRGKLWDRLAETVNIPDSPVHILISMREEWLGAWEEANDYLPDSLSSLYRLAPLTDREIKRAIKKPASIEGSITFSDELVSTLMADLRRPSAYGLGAMHIEPGLLQLVCRRLWNEAQLLRKNVVEPELYASLGGADRIIREFVWNALGSAGEETTSIQESTQSNPLFTAHDRVLWVGLTRHLTVAHGVKAIVSPRSLAKQLIIDDMGLAGLPVATYELDSAGEAYLEKIPEKRTDPPESVENWITSILNKACAAGFMKRQKRGDLYELAHDSLADTFQVFKIEFEGWLRSKYYKLLGVLFGTLIVLPVSAFMIVSTGLYNALVELGVMTIALALYVVAMKIFMIVGKFIYKLIFGPIIRYLCRGRVQMPTTRN